MAKHRKGDEPQQVEIEGEGTTADPTAVDGQMDSQTMPTTDGEMIDPAGEEGWAEFQRRGALE